MRRFFCAAIALLLAVSGSQSADKGDKKAEEQPQFVSGAIRSLDVKDGVGTLTILALKSKQGNDVKFAEMKFAVTKDTKFYWGGKLGADGRPAKQGKPVDPDDIAAGLIKVRFLWVYFTVEGEKMTAISVDGHP